MEKIEMKTITICGSMRFSEQMKRIAWKLESDKGYTVIQCVYNENNEPVDENMIIKMTQAHFKKIDLSDAIYVVDINNYIGTAVNTEIFYAQKNAKEVIYHSKQLDV